jgi:tetratricopeptide (TPR) repeat protein
MGGQLGLVGDSLRRRRTVAERRADLFEPRFNLALMHYKLGDFQEAHNFVRKALALYPGHLESQDLKQNLTRLFEAF